MQRLVPLHEAARLAGCSIRFLRDHHRDKIIVVGPRMHRMRVGHALNIAEPSKQPAAQAAHAVTLPHKQDGPDAHRAEAACNPC